MPIRMPLVYGIASRPARSIASRRTSGSLSGEPKCGPPRCDSRALAVSSMMPCDAQTSRRASSSSSSRMPGLACGSRPGLAQHEARAVRQVGGRGGEAEPVELLARRPVAQLGLVAEREQRLVAAGEPPAFGDREHLLLAHVAALAAPRRPGERAVVADVAAEVRERDEDLRRVGHERPGRALARALAQVGQRRPALGIGQRLVRRQRRVGSYVVVGRAGGRTRGADAQRVRHARILAPITRDAAPHSGGRSQSARRRGAISAAKRSRKPSWSSAGLWKTRWRKPSSR